ncbi:hypothetical protein HEP_00429100 [Hepatocystis sp. ex Piliocolobus tephrosceles]|nr:hypothetical protein HEP_00429100 [Hepatocystis sp. ex Piliocolobus tephrosceles]
MLIISTCVHEHAHARANGRISRGSSTGDIYMFNDQTELITKKLFDLHKNNEQFEDIMSKKRSLRKNYKKSLKQAK